MDASPYQKNSRQSKRVSDFSVSPIKNSPQKYDKDVNNKYDTPVKKLF